jgi:glycosyltransferase involved in cell wall biosynthesis
VNSKLIFIGYDLTLSALENQSLVSGEVKNANYLMQSLNEIGVDILPISINLTDKESNVTAIKKSSAKGVFRWYREAKKLNVLLDKQVKPGDIIYLTIPSYLPFLKVKKNIKVAITAHGTYWPELIADLKYENSKVKKALHLVNGFFQLRIDKRSYTKANLIHSVSDYQIDEMVKTYSVERSKIVSIRNGTNFSKIDVEKKFDFIWVGRLAKKKNIKLFIDFIEQVGFTNVCMCVGSDYFAIDSKSKELIKNYEFNDRVKVVKDISDKELNCLMSQSSCLVVSSTGYESIPTVIFEGIASGCKVLAPDSWGVREVEGSGVYLYEEGCLESLKVEYEKSLCDISIPELHDEARWDSRAKKFKEFFQI